MGARYCAGAREEGKQNFLAERTSVGISHFFRADDIMVEAGLWAAAWVCWPASDLFVTNRAKVPTRSHLLRNGYTKVLDEALASGEAAVLAAVEFLFVPSWVAFGVYSASGTWSSCWCPTRRCRCSCCRRWRCGRCCRCWSQSPSMWLLVSVLASGKRLKH